MAYLSIHVGRSSITAGSGQATRCDRLGATASAVPLGVFTTTLYAPYFSHRDRTTLLSLAYSPYIQNSYGN